MLIKVSIQDFITHGKFSNLLIGQSNQQIRDHFASPDAFDQNPEQFMGSTLAERD